VFFINALPGEIDMKNKGFILYQGPSVLDGMPIVVIATLETDNRKTGNMVQTWILRSDIDPITAYKRKMDYSICGNCPQRWALGGACYVNIGQAPLSIYRAYLRGSYADFNPELHSKYIQGRMIRLGAYGDPAAVPFEIMHSLVKLSAGHTGYTHQITHKNFDSRYLEICMISADTSRSAEKAIKQGARVFQVIATDATPPADLMECLSDSKGISCIDCGLCNGSANNPSIYIRAHGLRKGNFLNNKIVSSITARG